MTFNVLGGVAKLKVGTSSNLKHRKIGMIDVYNIDDCMISR